MTSLSLVLSLEKLVDAEVSVHLVGSGALVGRLYGIARTPGPEGDQLAGLLVDRQHAPGLTVIPWHSIAFVERTPEQTTAAGGSTNAAVEDAILATARAGMRPSDRRTLPR